MTTNHEDRLARSSLKGLPLKPIDPVKLAALQQVLSASVEEMRKKRKKKQPIPTDKARDSNTV